MSQVEFLAPTTPETAAKALLAGGAAARPLSGGTDLLVQLRSGRLPAGMIVDLKRIPGAMGIRQEAGGFIIGAATPGMTVTEHAGLAKAWPGVVEAVNLIGSTQIKGRASMAGNLCNASPAADSVPAMTAARATCLIVGPEGRRTVSVEAIAVGPGRNSLGPGEFVLEIHLPARPPRSADAYLRSTPRTEMDIAVVGAAVNVTLDAAGVITHARVSLGAVAPTQLLVIAGADAIIGSRLDDAALAKLDAAARAVCNPIDDKRGTIDFRIKVAGVLARRAASIAMQRALGQAAGTKH